MLDEIDQEFLNEETDAKTEPDTEEESTILKPTKRGRRPLTDKQKKALALGRRNHQLRMAKKKIDEIEQEQLKEEEDRTPTRTKSNKPKKIVLESSSDDEEDKVIIVKRKKKKKKPKKKIIYESETSSDSDDQPPSPQRTHQPTEQPFKHPVYEYRGGMFR